MTSIEWIQIFLLFNVSRPKRYLKIWKLFGCDEKGCKMDVDEHRPSTGLKSAVWSTSTKKNAVASTSTSGRVQAALFYWSTSTILHFSTVDVDCRRRRLPFSRSTTGSPFHHAQLFDNIWLTAIIAFPENFVFSKFKSTFWIKSQPTQKYK